MPRAGYRVGSVSDRRTHRPATMIAAQPGYRALLKTLLNSIRCSPFGRRSLVVRADIRNGLFQRASQG